MLVSVIIPACAAQETIARAVRSVVAQSWDDWEAIVVSDDGVDYRAFLGSVGASDVRLRFVATRARRSGCHNARNVGLGVARGDIVAMLDADDIYHPRRLEKLAPLAAECGAVTDNVAVVSEDCGRLLYRVLGNEIEPSWLTSASFLKLTAPLFPVVRRDFARQRRPGVEHAEDVVVNLDLIDKVGRLPIFPATLMEYRVRAGSMCHSPDSAAVFDHSYATLIANLLDPADGLGLKPEMREVVCRGLIAKRGLNRAFASAQRNNPSLNFQSFVAAIRASGAEHFCP